MNKYVLFTFEPNPAEIEGWFDWQDGYIYINKRLCKLDKILTYVHENQHRECFNKKCKCTGNTYLEEYHAFNAELDYAINNPYIRKRFIKGLKDILDKAKRIPEVYESHGKVVRKLMKTKKFKEYF